MGIPPKYVPFMASASDADKSSVRSQDRTLRTRQNLIAAGLHEFAAHGYEPATLKAIAKKAGVTVPVLKYHFPSKDELWRASAEKVFGEFLTTFGTVFETTAGLTARVRAEALITEAVVFFAQHPEFHRFMTGDARSERAAWLAATHLKPLHRVFDSVMADLDSNLGEDVPDRTHLFYMFVGAAASPYALADEYQQANGASPYDAEAVNQHAESMILTFLPPKDRLPE